MNNTEVPSILVNSANTDEILRFDTNMGKFIDVFISGSGSENSLDSPSTSVFGPDGNLYVSSGLSNEILRFDGNTGEFIDVFASEDGLDFPGAFIFGPDGNLYVSNTLSNEILRFDGNTGEFIDVFASKDELINPAALTFGLDGNLYVSSSGFFDPNSTGTGVVRFDGNTGEFIDIFTSGGNLTGPVGLGFGLDDNLYVSSNSTNEVLRFDGRTGEFIDVFASGNGLDGPAGLKFGPDNNLYVSSNSTNEVLRFDGRTGEFIDVVASGNGLDFISNVTFTTSNENLEPGAVNEITNEVKEFTPIDEPTNGEVALSLNDVFDESYYLETNPEAAQAIANGEFDSGLEHFQAVGVDRGLRFSPLIDQNYYQNVANPDLADLSNRKALDHLLEVGIEQGRLFSPFVNINFYQETNPDLRDLSKASALLQLQDFGLDRGLQFSPFVNLDEYRSFSPELSNLSLSETFAHLATSFAPDDEGRIRMPFFAGRFSAVDTVNIVTPELLEGSGEAIFTYSKSTNKVVMELYIEGLPFRPDITRAEDVSTPFNQQPISVEDGKWQIWLVSKVGTAETTFWYDGQTGDLIGNEFDVLETPSFDDTPIDINGDEVVDTPIQLPANQAIGSPLFEGNPEGTVDVTFEFAYDRLLDERGTGGVYASVVPYNLDRQDEVGIYYTEGGLPVSEAANWDDVLTTMRDTGSFSLFTSLEPDPKPDFLASRDNTMVAHASSYPTIIPKGIVFDAIANNYRFAEATDLVTNSGQPWPARRAEITKEIEQVFGDLTSNEFDAVDFNDDFDGNRDTLFTGAGDDSVDASQASAPLFPSTEGNNRLYGGTGLDELFARRRDVVSGGVGEDILDASAGFGNNRLDGGEGNDELFAGSSDRLFAGSGDDLLDATNGNEDNRLYGQDGNDTFFLGSKDRLLGGDGDDAFFVTNGGDNLITGGEGADAFWIATSELITTANTITDFELDTDVIGVAGIGVTSIDDLELSQVNNNALLSFSGFDLAILSNTQVSDLQSSDTFAFA